LKPEIGAGGAMVSPPISLRDEFLFFGEAAQHLKGHAFTWHEQAKQRPSIELRHENPPFADV